jgi:hypothetical protein
MKRSRLSFVVLLVAILSLCLLSAYLIAGEKGKGNGCGKSEEKAEVQITLQDLPPAVLATLNNEVAGGTIQCLEKEEKDGVVVYSADITKTDGKQYEVEIAADGNLIKCELEEAKCEKSEDACKDKEVEKDKKCHAGETQ